MIPWVFGPVADYLAIAPANRARVAQALVASGQVESSAELVANVAHETKLDASDLEGAVQGLLAFVQSHLGSRHDAPQYVKQFVDRMQGEAPLISPEFAKTVAELNWDEIADELTLILGAEAVQVAAKASEIAGLNERVVRRVRVLSDVRPVFRASVAGGPATAVVTHTLRLECQSDFRHHHYFVFSGKTLHELKKIVDRALEKERVLEEGLASGLQIKVFRDGGRE